MKKLLPILFVALASFKCSKEETPKADPTARLTGQLYESLLRKVDSMNNTNRDLHLRMDFFKANSVEIYMTLGHQRYLNPIDTASYDIEGDRIKIQRSNGSVQNGQLLDGEILLKDSPSDTGRLYKRI